MKELAVTLKRIADGPSVVAVYLPHEERAIVKHIADAERRGTAREIVQRELEFLHLMKATFEAVIVP